MAPTFLLCCCRRCSMEGYLVLSGRPSADIHDRLLTHRLSYLWSINQQDLTDSAINSNPRFLPVLSRWMFLVLFSGPKVHVILTCACLCYVQIFRRTLSYSCSQLFITSSNIHRATGPAQAAKYLHRISMQAFGNLQSGSTVQGVPTRNLGAAVPTRCGLERTTAKTAHLT